ncbi:MAG: LCP family protein [Mycobacteriaceae bacterium]|nr:LCP family protein [Mycobacteriaceae bacterium]
MHRWLRGPWQWAAVGIATVVVAVTGTAWWIGDGVHRSWLLGGAESATAGNILVIGLDSRLDQDGNPLPRDIYRALHAGGASDGGENANVLMLVHVPKDGGRATSISIPRDDYVALPGCPAGHCQAKIKHAYGLAFDVAQQQLAHTPGLTQEQRVQQARDAGRKAQIEAVDQFLGVRIDHFVEVTMVAFYEIAKVVQPVTVCVDHATRDSYSGANFHAGMQQLSGVQAVAFVRQRRDESRAALNFSDLDRERRQQAFLASLAHRLQESGTLTDPRTLMGLFDVAKRNIAVDGDLDLLGFARSAADLAGNTTFVTLPVVKFGRTPEGEDVNIVDVPAVQALVRGLLDDKAHASSRPDGTIDVVNANGEEGLAGRVQRALVTVGYRGGSTGNGADRADRTVVYHHNNGDAAGSLAKTLGGAETQPDNAVPAGHLRVVLGEDFTMPTALLEAVQGPAPGTGISPAPIPAGLSVPCVK